MSSTRPRVSIGLPVYNGQKYLACALDSLLAQTYTDFELIISDNASTDDTIEICREYGARDKRVRVERQHENIGAVGNFNRVFELSQGEYFKWAACDDVCAPEFLARCIGVLDHDRSIVCCHAKSVPIDSSGHCIDDSRIEVVRNGKWKDAGVAGCARYATSPFPHARFRDVLLNSGFGVRCYGLIRSEKLRRTGMLLPVYGYEKIMMAELSLLGRFHLIPEPLFFQRIHADASASLEFLSEQQEFFAPQSAARRAFPRLQYLRGYLRAARRFSRSAGERLQCYLWVAAYLAQVRKWRRVMTSTLQGTGTGGTNTKLLFPEERPGRAAT